MNLQNHLLSAILITECYLAYTGHLWNPQMILNPEELIVLAPTTAAIFTGAVFPDIDMHFTIKDFHRTVFHWPYPYMALIALAVFILPKTPGVIDIIIGFALAALIHIEMDSHTKSGVPLGYNPFGEKSGTKILRVNSPEELLVSVIIMVIGLVVYWGPVVAENI